MKTSASSGLSLRGDSLYCPLSFSLDTYSNCLCDCWHCYLRRLNYVWGGLDKISAIDTDVLQKKLSSGLKNTNPKSPLAHAIKSKKTIRFGNKSDPFQPVEKEHMASYKALRILFDLQWPTVIQTMCTGIMTDYLLEMAPAAKYFVVQPIISPGGEIDWERLERRRTTPISDRLTDIKKLLKVGFFCAVNGEPFIPGFHEEFMFEDTIKRLKSAGIKHYNTYNFHFNDFVAKRLVKIGIDIEKIWEMNQDKNWKPILARLFDIADKHGVVLGCPDFVNMPSDRRNETNTCCGIDVPSPTTFNTHIWRNMVIDGKPTDEIIAETFDGIGDVEEGQKVLRGKSSEFYTMADAGLVKKTKEGLLF